MTKEQVAKRARERYMARKTAGLCVRCGTPCDGETVFCETHRETHKTELEIEGRR